MATDPAREKVTRALRTSKTPPPAPPPVGDDLLGDALGPPPGEGVSAEDIDGWKGLPETLHAVKVMRTRYQSLAKALIAGAESSTDPRVAGQGARLKELASVVTALTPRKG